jgi:NADPH:quinone reductase-like Zn-dependent oxidoreductase
MQRIELSAFGLENLQLLEAPVPEPGIGEVRIKVGACSINYRDFMIASGFYKTDIPMPLVPLSDCAGTIDAVGAGVADFSVGERVVSLLWQDWEAGPLEALKRTRSTGCEAPGVLSEYVVLPVNAIVPAPLRLSDAEAACLPAAGLTAFAALTTFGELRAGGTVLTLGTGGVSLFALQFAKAMGATVVITSSSDEKLARAKALGADHTINYATELNWGERCFDLTGGADVVIETAGAGTLTQSMAAVAYSGRIAYIGALAGMAGEANLMPLVLKNASIHGITVSHREDHRRMTRFIDGHGIKPVIDHVYDLAGGIEAIKAIASGRHFGKLVVALN